MLSREAKKKDRTGPKTLPSNHLDLDEDLSPAAARGYDKAGSGAS